MTAFDLRLDPVEVAINRTELALNSPPITVDYRGVDWGDAAITNFLADARVGSLPVGRRWPNRTIVIPLIVQNPTNHAAYSTAKQQLMQKVARIQTDGFGWFKRQAGVYADVVNATLSWPDIYGETSGFERDIVLTLECIPDFYGDEITLDQINSAAIKGGGSIFGVLKQSGVQASIQGAYPGRVRIQVRNQTSENQTAMLWGFRSRHSDTATSAAMVIEAEDMTRINGTTSSNIAGSGNSAAAHFVALGTNSWISMLSTTLSTGAAPLTHQGSYNVWVRAHSSNAQPQVRLLWGEGSLSNPVTNDAVTLPGFGAWYLLNLGQVRLDAPPAGSSHQWQGVVQVMAAQANNDLDLDAFYFQPVDETSGQLIANPATPPSTFQSSAGTNTSPRTYADNASIGSVAWTSLGIHEAGQVALASAGQTSHYLTIENWGFAVPSTATIKGVKVSVYHQLSGSGEQVAPQIHLIKAGTIQAAGRGLTGIWSSGSVTDTYGSNTDLWGTTLTATDVNNTGFGVAISVDNYFDVVTVQILVVTTTVYWSFSDPFTVASDAVLYGNSSAITAIRTDGAWRSSDGTTFGPVASVIGDLPRIPVSGVEGRAVELFTRVSDGDLAAAIDQNLSLHNATVIYRPSWLFAP